MQSAYELYVFDWDGTVMDTTALIAKGIQHAACQLGYPQPSYELASSIIGLDWRTAISIVVPEMPPSDYERFGEFYRDWYIPNEAKDWLFPDMKELLEGMHANGYRLAVATGKSRRGLERVFQVTGIGEVFEATRTADECASKPNPLMLEEIAIECAVDPRQMVMIGDTTHDLMMANAFHCDAIAMSYGAQSVEMLQSANPKAICHSVRELAAHLNLEGLLARA